jgi:hypothetical protein
VLKLSFPGPVFVKPLEPAKILFAAETKPDEALTLIVGLDPANVATLLAEFPESTSPFVESLLFHLIPFKYGIVELIEK